MNGATPFDEYPYIVINAAMEVRAHIHTQSRIYRECVEQDRYLVSCLNAITLIFVSVFCCCWLVWFESPFIFLHLDCCRVRNYIRVREYPVHTDRLHRVLFFSSSLFIFHSIVFASFA